jgi:phosphatidylinositol alpha 1,6-mannosyltransferase
VVRIALIAETYLPAVNGVTYTLEKVRSHLLAQGHRVLVIAPSSGNVIRSTEADGATVIQLPAMPVAGYSDIRVAVGGVPKLKRLLADFAPDVVHLASPFELGRRAAKAAEQLGIPTLAIYQTDVPGYLARYGVAFLENLAWQRVANIHQGVTRTLAPSSAALAQLTAHGVPRVELWGRGVDTDRFNPRRRSERFRRSVASRGELLIGYVGRLAAEKQVEDLARVQDIPGAKLVIVGDGPQRAMLEAKLPRAHFTGFLAGDALGTAMASLDLFVHPGELETFCQTIQEAMASGVPVVATGRGGPLDLVDPSRTGWLYPPGDLDQLRVYARDLLGDDAKRAAFAEAALASVQKRTWPVLCERLEQHYREVIAEHQLLHLGRR